MEASLGPAGSPAATNLALADALLLAAVQHVCPMVADMLLLPSNRAQACKRQGGPDISCRAPRSLFCGLLMACAATPGALSAPAFAASGRPDGVATGDSAAESDPIAEPRSPMLGPSPPAAIPARSAKRRRRPSEASLGSAAPDGDVDGRPDGEAEAAWAGRDSGARVRQGNAAGCVVVTTRSEYGVSREREFRCARELAEALVEGMESAPEALRGAFRDIRASDDGGLALLSWDCWRSQTRAGYLLCPACGRFYAGERGLKAHQQAKHRSSYEAATGVAASAKLQLIPFAPPFGAPPLPAAPPRQQACVSKTVLPPAFVAARDGDLAALKVLIAAGFDVHTEDEHGSNALLWAAGGGHLHVCRYLVEECGVPADIYQAASQGGPRRYRRRRNALHWAARHGHLPVCQWLVDERAVDVNSTTADGTCALHWAVWQGHLALCKWLVYQAAAAVGHVNEHGCNASQWAAQTDDLDMCRWLAAVGLDWKIVNRNGHSALHKAANKGQWRVCEWLLNEECLGLEQMGADKDGNTPAVMAALEGHPDLSAALRTAEARLRGASTGPDGRGPFPPREGPSSQDDSDGGLPGLVQRGSSQICPAAALRAAKLAQRHELLPRLQDLGVSASGGGPLVSVVLPVFNAEAFLDECLRGVANQAYRPLELAVCDNGSTDSSAAIVRSWTPRLERLGIRVICVATGDADRRGCGFARNRAIEASSGRFICSADADDVMLPGRVEAQLAAALGAPGALVGARFCREPHDAAWHYTAWANSMTQEQLRQQQFRECTVLQPTWFYAREVWQRAGPFVEEPEEGLDPPGAERPLADDLRFFYRHLAAGGSLARVDRVLVIYRHHGGQLSHATPRALITAIKARALEEMVLRKWPNFTVWGAGRDGKAFVAALSAAARQKLVAFADVDPRKCGTMYENAKLSVCVPVVHFSEAQAPIVCCVARGRTGGAFEANLASLGLTEGVDYWSFA